MSIVKILRRDPVDILGWEEVILGWEEVEDAGLDTIRVTLNDGQVIQISETVHSDGLNYLSVQTPDGIIVVYPEAQNKIEFRVIQR
jgi:hypothetical protein